MRVVCASCGQALNMPEPLKSTRFRCPKCKTVGEVPQTSAPAPTPAPAPRPPSRPAPARTPAPAPQTAESWFVQTEDGQQFGPITKPELDAWVAEARITAACQVLREGDGQWQWADQVYPALQAAAAGTQVSAVADSPFAISTTGGTSNPYASPQSYGGMSSARGYQKPHRATLVLTLAILGWAICAIFAPVAWIMANSDLAEMKRGRMDRSGQSTTKAAMVLSMIQTILVCISLVFVLGAIVIGSMSRR